MSAVENDTPDATPQVGDVIEMISTETELLGTGVLESYEDGSWIVCVDAGGLKTPQDGRVRCVSESGEWHGSVSTAPVTRSGDRRDSRAPAGRSPILVRTQGETQFTKGQRSRAVCLDFSESGCRTTWHADPPAIGDAVQLAWGVEENDEHQAEPTWVEANVTRVLTMSFGVRQIAFAFKPADLKQVRCVRDWRDHWMAAYRVRLIADPVE